MSQQTDRVRQFFEEVWNRGKLEFLDQNAGDRYQMHMSLVGDVDKDSFKAVVRMFRSAFPDLKFQIDDVIDAGDRVVARWSAKGTHRGELFGLAPTGRAGEVNGISIVEFENGKMADSYSNWDALALLQQIGAAPEMRAGAAERPRPTVS